MRWATLAVIMLATPFFARYGLAGRRGGARWALFLLGVVVVGSVPALLPADPFFKLVACLWALITSFRLADFAWDRYPDATLRTRWPHFLITFLAASDARWIEPEARGEARRRGLRIIARGLAKLPFALGLLALSTAYPALLDQWLAQTFWLLWSTYFLFTGAFDLFMMAPWYLVGVPVAEAFDAPPLATSPRDFWSRRWNLVFKRLSHRHIFTPLDGRRRPLLAVSVVFLFSAVVHELIVLMSLGRSQGHMLAFFTIHGVATVGYGALTRGRGGRPFMPRPAAVAAHLAFFTVTAWLFFQPLLEIVPIHTVRLW